MSYSIRAMAMSAVAIPVLMFAAPASAQSVAGTWEASVPTRVTNENGVMTPSAFNTVTLVIELKGDSVFATWTPAPMEGTPAPKTRALKGTMQNGAAVLGGDPTEGRINRGGEEQVIKMYTTYTLKVTGDALEGTMSASSPDIEMQVQDRLFKATRKKA